MTLFHKLPAERRNQLEVDLANEAGTLSAFTINVRGLRFLGRGVAYDLSSPDTEVLRARLATRWRELLGPQDSQPIRSHVTIQNKVEPAEARQLRDELEARFIPFIVRGEGLDLWEYRGGPWAHLRTFLFAANGEAVEGTQKALMC